MPSLLADNLDYAVDRRGMKRWTPSGSGIDAAGGLFSGMAGMPMDLLQSAINAPGKLVRPAKPVNLPGTSEHIGGLLGVNTQSDLYQAGLIGAPDFRDIGRVATLIPGFQYMQRADLPDWADASDSADDVLAFVKKKMGLTDELDEAGYVTKDGDLLDFSGKRDGGDAGVRHMDHRDIAYNAGTGSPTDDMLEFQKRTESVRVDFGRDRGRVSANFKPSDEQLEILEDGFMGRGEVHIDFDHPRTGDTIASTTLTNPTAKDLRRFFNDAYDAIDDLEHREWVRNAWGN